MQQKSLKENLTFTFKTLLEQGLLLLIPILFIRFYDFFLFKSPPFISYFELFKTFSLIIARELKVILPYLFTIGIFLTLIKAWSKRFYWVLSTIFILLLYFIYLSTLQYYHTANLRLDHVILFFTFDELKHIASSETGNLLNQYLWFYLIPLLCLILLLVFRKKIIHLFVRSKMLKIIAVVFMIGIVLSNIVYHKDLTKKGEELVSSKTYFLFHSIYTYSKSKDALKNVSKNNRLMAIKNFRKFMDWESNQHQFAYPFVKELNLNKGDLSEYFNAFDDRPNLVMVFCEGLSSTFSGPGAKYGSLTPQIDSIYAKSLYWPNAISNTDRTHGVFSNALAALPHGFERGILNIRTPFPEHLSIPKILGKNGYQSSFTYGGWGYFDNYEPFLKMNYVQNIHDNVFLKENGIIADAAEGKKFSWGVHDQKIVDIYFNLKQEDNSHPFFDIIITLSLHSPYEIPNQEKYLAISKKQFNKVNGDQKLYNDYKKVLSTIAYQDQAIGKLMRKYQRRADYENTIFLFVGDHNVNALPIASRLETHHVPLAIFSPKLKTARQFDDIVSQADIPQSLLALFAPYLDQEKMPKYSNWLGGGLSTNNQTKSTEPIFIGRFSGDIVGVINKDTLLLDEQLYQIHSKLEIEDINDSKRKAYYQEMLQNYRILNSYVINNNKLLTTDDAALYPNEKAYFYFPED